MPRARGNALKNVGAIIAVLLGIPCFFIGLFGVAGVLMGEKLIVGSLGAVWAYLAVTGSYELIRRRFDWNRGRSHRDPHLLAGTVAVSTGLVLSGAMHETMPFLALVPAISATVQANDGHTSKYRSMLHAAVLAAGFVIGSWFYADGVIGKILIDRIQEFH